VVGVMALGDRVVGGGFAIGALVGAVTAVAGVVTVGIVLVKRAGARADRE
jgi:hypothetical protein